MLKAIIGLSLVMSMSLPAFASGVKTEKKISSQDILDGIAKSDLGKAAMKMGKGCEKSVRREDGPFPQFWVKITCSAEGDENVGGGIYLMIDINGYYYGDYTEVKKIEVMRAG